MSVEKQTGRTLTVSGCGGGRCCMTDQGRALSLCRLGLALTHNTLHALPQPLPFKGENYCETDKLQLRL